MSSLSICTTRLVSVSTVAAALSLFGCSATTGGPGTTGSDGGLLSGQDGGGVDGGGSGDGGGGGGIYKCCVNRAFYDCGNKAAFDKCAGFDFGACMAACGDGDFMCLQGCNDQAATSMPDPSSCARVEARDSECTAVCVAGKSCTYSTQCDTNEHCSDGRCHADKPGCPCTYSTQCGTDGHCTSGTCYRDERGAPCTYSTDCPSGSSCVSGKCS